jgi:hypothetical protein
MQAQRAHRGVDFIDAPGMNGASVVWDMGEGGSWTNGRSTFR